MAVGAVVDAGARQVFPQLVTAMLQESVEADVEAVAVVDGIEPGLEGVAELLLVGLAHGVPLSWVSLFQQGGHVLYEVADIVSYLTAVHYGVSDVVILVINGIIGQAR